MDTQGEIIRDIGYSIDDLSDILKGMRKFEKIIKSNELVNKWYELGNVKISCIMGCPCIHIFRLINYSIPSMDKSTKDSIIKFLKTKKLIFWSMRECYILPN